MSGTLRLGTRRSPLALAQSRLVADALTVATGRSVHLVEVTTEGDVSSEPLQVIGGSGVFVSALRAAVLGGTVDLAVHSLKDLPVAAADGLVLAAVPTRADPRDALISAGDRPLATLRPGAVVGTGSPRRAGQLLAARPDLRVAGIRGNVDTRIAKVRAGEVDAVLLAVAGLDRLGRRAEAAEVLEPELMLPAPGQGALAVECAASSGVAALLSAVDDPATRAAVTAERALLGALEAGCSAPVGALATADGPGALLLRVVVGGAGGAVHRASARGDNQDPVGLGRRLANVILSEMSDTARGVGVL